MLKNVDLLNIIFYSVWNFRYQKMLLKIFYDRLPLEPLLSCATPGKTRDLPIGADVYEPCAPAHTGRQLFLIRGAIIGR